MEIKKTIGFVILLVVLLSSSVFAFGVSSPYWKGNALGIYPGETKTVRISYQNMGDNVEDVMINAEITKGTEIATLEDKEFLVKAGTKNTAVEIQVFVPPEVIPGTTYQITLTSRTATPGAQGGVALGLGVDTTFDVEVIPEPAVEKETQELAETSGNLSQILFVLLAITIIAVVIVFLVRKRNK